MCAAGVTNWSDLDANWQTETLTIRRERRRHVSAVKKIIKDLKIDGKIRDAPCNIIFTDSNAKRLLTRD